MPRVERTRTRRSSPALYTVPLYVSHDAAPQQQQQQQQQQPSSVDEDEEEEDELAEPAAGPSKSADPSRKHPCLTCGKAFTTSGHLARHQRTHTGERDFKCPFPECETRCSRQDNLQQHYRVHLSPESKKASNADNRAAMKLARDKRAAVAAAAGVAGPSRRRTAGPPTTARRAGPDSPPSSPPPLGDADADILLGLRPPNPLPNGQMPTAIWVPASPRTAARLGLPPPPVTGPGVPGPVPCIQLPDGSFMPYIPGRTPCIARTPDIPPPSAPVAGPSKPRARRAAPRPASPPMPGLPASLSRQPRNLPVASSSSATLSPLHFPADLPSTTDVSRAPSPSLLSTLPIGTHTSASRTPPRASLARRAELCAPVLPAFVPTRGPGFDQDVRPQSLLLTGPGAPGHPEPRPDGEYTPPAHAPPDVAELYGSRSVSPAPADRRGDSSSGSRIPVLPPVRAAPSHTPPPWASSSSTPGHAFTPAPNAYHPVPSRHSSFSATTYALEPRPAPPTYSSAPAPAHAAPWSHAGAPERPMLPPLRDILPSAPYPRPRDDARTHPRHSSSFHEFDRAAARLPHPPPYGSGAASVLPPLVVPGGWPGNVLPPPGGRPRW